MLDFKDYGPLPESDDPRIDVPRGRVEGRVAPRGLTMTSADQAQALTPDDGFAAMFEFLSSYWTEFKTANLADVLGDIQPDGGGTSDPAAWWDWLRSVEKVLAHRG
ncbi:MAG TPA: hypothetical protein VNU19_11120 [Candidatus Acidoferrum sp.]|jgi:hypothetical protein|nr:hypothetical protein [Candidatus Acidoferrum sp.]